jgi:hypothetical protein
MSLPTIFELVSPATMSFAAPSKKPTSPLTWHGCFAAKHAMKQRAQCSSSPTPISTEGLKNLLHNVCLRFAGRGGEASAIFRLHTSTAAAKRTR